MRLFFCLCFSFIFLSQVNAQLNYFVYIQTENKQPFNIRLNEKIFSSTASGYVIIPRLTNGIYKSGIQFPARDLPSLQVEFAVKENDAGFLLKNFGQTGWGLFNIETMDVLMASKINVVSTIIPETKTDEFSSVLAEVTNTPAIRQQFPDSTLMKGSQDSVKYSINEVVKREDIPSSISTKQFDKIFTTLDNSGRSAIYTIDDGNKSDTIRIFIPYEMKETGMIMAKKEVLKEGQVKTDSIIPVNVLPGSVAKKADTLNAPGKFKTEIQKPADIIANEIKNGKADSSHNMEYNITILNPSCTASATESDFLKLRKKMAAEDADENMIVVAKKSFHVKCFTTEQVKNLGLLFLKDEGKYNFYDAAYGHVIDPANFKDLQSQLTEEYYITRFKAMLH